MSQSYHTTLAVSRLMARLGVKSPTVPTMDVGSYTPVVVMADFSRSLTSEPFEARGIAGEWLNNVSGRCWGMDLHANAPGGCVVEQFGMATEDAMIGNFVIGVGTFQDQKLTEPTPLLESIVQEIGGINPQSKVYVGRKPFIEPFCSLLSSSFNHQQYFDQRIYIHPGQHFLMMSSHLNRDTGMWLVFRELPEAQGPA